MSVPTLLSYGTIAKIQAMDKGYTKVVLSTNIPFQRKHIVFNIWDVNILQDETGRLNTGDCVTVIYHFKEQFTVLDNISRIDRLDNCPICFSDLDPIDTQRMGCPKCSSMNETEYKDRICENMKLLSYSLNEYKFSSGYRLEFITETSEKKFIGVIFQNNPLFDKINHLNISETYFVVGWKSKDNFLLKPFEIIEIDEAI